MHEPTQATILAAIAGMAVLNFAVRFVPLALLRRISFPAPLLRWLSYVPISVMGALVASEVLRPGGTLQSPLTNPGIPAALLTMAVYRFTSSFLGATIVGIVSFVAIRAALG